MTLPGTADKPLQVAVVGSGPSGFYAAEALIKSEASVKVHLFDRLPSPYGLVRSGVAPDHQKLKQVIKLYEKIAESPDFMLLANVNVGVDISIDELRETHHAVIITSGAETDRKLSIPGESLRGSHTATEFVGWYNGHPDYRDREFDLSHEVAVIIGQGNVAADISRILSKTVDELKHTDIARHALDVLAESKVKEIHVIGRRGPAQAKFTPKELREFAELSDCNPVVDMQELVLNSASQIELEEKTGIGNKKIYVQFCEFSKINIDNDKNRRCYFRFLLSPIELEGKEQLRQVKFEINTLSGEAFKQSARGTGETFQLEAGLLFRSIGYRGVPIEGVPFREDWGTIPNIAGRITDNDGNFVKQLYTAGWIKRGPTGIIGTNRACSVETVNALLEDLTTKLGTDSKTGIAPILKRLHDNHVAVVQFDDWKKIDAEEIRIGRGKGKPREKFTHRSDMLSLIKN